MISKYHLAMYLPDQQSGNLANLTEPELPVTIPQCPAIHFHFLPSLASHYTFSDFLLERLFFFFFCIAITERKMLLAAGVQSPKRCCSRNLSSRTILVVYRAKNISSALNTVPRHGHSDPAAPERESAVTWMDVLPQPSALVSTAGISSIPAFFSLTLGLVLSDRYIL